MNETDIVKLLGPYGVLAVVGYLVAKFVGKVVVRFLERLIAALDRVGAKIDEHTVVDREAHAEVREAIGRLDARVTEIVDLGERREATGRVELVARTSNPARLPPPPPVAGSSRFRTEDEEAPQPPRRQTRPRTAPGDE